MDSVQALGYVQAYVDTPASTPFPWLGVGLMVIVITTISIIAWRKYK